MHLSHAVRAIALDFRFAWRGIVRAPSVALLIMTTLAVGIGANATLVGTISRLLLDAPPGVAHPRDVVELVISNPAGRSGFARSFDYPALADFQSIPAFASVAAYSSATLSLGRGPNAIEVRATLVSPGFFTVLGAAPHIGRLFSESDGYPAAPAEGGPPLAVLSHGFWQRHFGGNRAVVGMPIHVGTVLYTVIGVAAEDFSGLEGAPPDVWIPIGVAAPAEMPSIWYAGRGSSWVSLFARLRSPQAIGSAADRATNVWRAAHPVGIRRSDSQARIIGASIIRGRAPDAPREVRVSFWLGGVSILLLLIACANATNLLLAQAFARRRELATRIALGAGRLRLMQQMIVEAGIIVAGASLGAAALAVAGGQVMSQLLLSGHARRAQMVDLRVLMAMTLVGLLVTISISLAPMLYAVRANLSTLLRVGHANARLRSVLLGVQAGLSIILLIAAGLFAMSLYRVDSLDIGIDRDHTLMARFDLTSRALPKPEIERAYHQMASDVRSLPGVERVAFAEFNPYRNGRAVAARTPDRSADFFWHPGISEVPMEAAVDTGFFRTVGAKLRGRDFDSRDVPGGENVAIINEPLARILWPDRDALGRCVVLPVRFSDPTNKCYRVVGVVSGFWRRTILNRDLLLVYVPLTQRPVGGGPPSALFVRTTVDPASTIGAIRAAIQSVRLDLPAVSVGRLADAIDPEIRPWRLGTMMFGLFGVVALAIAVVGLYGVVSFTAAQRSSEIAVRVALGASPRHVLRVVAGSGLVATSVGLTLGWTVTWISERWIGSLLFETSPHDLRIVLGLAGLLLATTAVAAAVPTRRVLRRNPAAVLRID